MNKAELEALRHKLIRNINEIEDEEVLQNIGEYLASVKCPTTADYPFAPSKEELHSIIEQVLEDDRNGRFYTSEEVFGKLGILR
ncbi:hypothetical protein [Bacteroides sp. 51]|uniref:hypothetical protein n=1 Tax=Bacteroides sp. 51 TaxID=2302938 RepID=UPI0013D4338B|nr:hypothetical protein [Bacteroides sp. 51]NDV81639.1 hypothetical protein [Bacteroides sp. 51]